MISTVPTLFDPVKTVEKYSPRPYQAEAIDAAIRFFKGKNLRHAIEILPTGSGKSIVIANIAKALEGRTIVFQPSKEILEQNYAKFVSYGYRASIYSASVGEKRIDKVVFATIGSVARKHHLFKEFKNIIIDECHLVNPKPKKTNNPDGSVTEKGGMYYEFIKSLEGCKVLGMTASPYRLSYDSEGAMLKFLTRVRPRIFSDVIYTVQNKFLFDAGFLAKLEYFSWDVVKRDMLKLNSTGTDYTESSLRAMSRAVNMPKATAYYANRILEKRNLLVFCATVKDAMEASRLIPKSVVVTGETEKSLREKILRDFKAGIIRCVLNVGVLTTGFDYPELGAVLIARSIMSLGLYYQIVGRIMRTHPLKLSGWVVDLGGNIKRFGRIDTMKVEKDKSGLYIVSNTVNGQYRQLTNVPFQK